MVGPAGAEVVLFERTIVRLEPMTEKVDDQGHFRNENGELAASPTAAP